MNFMERSGFRNQGHSCYGEVGFKCSARNQVDGRPPDPHVATCAIVSTQDTYIALLIHTCCYCSSLR